MPAVQVNSNLSNWKPTLLTHCYGHLTRYKEGKSSPPYGSSREKAWIWCVVLILFESIYLFHHPKVHPTLEDRCKTVQWRKCNICLNIRIYLLYMFIYHGSLFLLFQFVLFSFGMDEKVHFFWINLYAGLHSDPNRAKLSDFQFSFGMDEKVNILFCGA